MHDVTPDADPAYSKDVRDRDTKWDRVTRTARVVIKVGTSSLVDAAGAFNLDLMKRLAYDVELLWQQGKEVIIVSSGAVQAGMDALGVTSRPRDVVEQQVLAAVGNPKLMEVYARFFTACPIAQLLITQENLSNRASFNHFRSAIEKMIEMGVVPVINENDVVSIDELTHPEGVEFNFSDNDVLSALVTASIRADLLVVLSDTDGLYTKHPNSQFAEFVPLVNEVTPEVKQMGQSGGKLGRGGMASKLYAAEIATRAGAATVIARAGQVSVLDLVTNTPSGTLFLPREALPDKKLWILYAGSPKGQLSIDAGAGRALLHGASLLVKGISRVTGSFSKGDVVSIFTEDERHLANGIANFSAQEVARVLAQPLVVRNELIELTGVNEIVSHENLTFL